MPLRFDVPEEEDKQAPKKATKKEEKGSDKDKPKGTHRRVFTNSSYYFAEISVTIVDAKNLTGKKSASPFCRIYIGSQIFNTSTKKKTLSPTWNETFTSKVDRDDFIQIRIYDQTKLEKQLENNEVEPMGKKKIPVKELTRVDTNTEVLPLVGGGELNIQYQMKVNTPQPGMIHTKFFNYPTWMNDKYNVNVQQPSFDSQKTAVGTLTRYAMRWLRNQKAIANLLDQDGDSDDEGKGESDVPDGVSFKLLDLCFASHDKALQLLVTYQWESKEKKNNSEGDDFGVSQILQKKEFHMECKLAKKKLNNIKPMLPDAYQKEFKGTCSSMDELMTEVHSWMEEKREEIGAVFKLIPISTYNSYHVVLLYYR